MMRTLIAFMVQKRVYALLADSQADLAKFCKSIMAALACSIVPAATGT
jgi:hypothetical protein